MMSVVLMENVPECPAEVEQMPEPEHHGEQDAGDEDRADQRDSPHDCSGVLYDS